MALNLLTARKVEAAQARPKAYTLRDGGSLFLRVQPNGSKLWWYRYRLADVAQIYSIGVFPEVALEAARGERDWARSMVRGGRNPTLERRVRVANQVAQNEHSFASVARAWVAANVQWGERYTAQVKTHLARDLLPALGKLPIAVIRTSHLRPIVQGLVESGKPTVAIVARRWCSQIFGYASAQGLCDNDPAALLRGAVRRPRVRHTPPLPWAEIAQFFTRLDGYTGFRTTILALRLMALTFVRTIELRMARWCEFDSGNALWVIPGERMKMYQAHIVPLSRQALAVLQELRALTGGGDLLLPNCSAPGQAMSASALNTALTRMGYGGRFSAHGFRSTATTLLGLLSYPENRVDLQLAHSKASKDASRAPYDHTRFIASRKMLMQDWADILDALAGGAGMDRLVQDFGPLSARRTELLRVIERE